MSDSSIKVIEANWSAPKGVRAITTTRFGGISSAPFNELNLGHHVGDSLENVIENRELLSKQLGVKLDGRWLKQVHGNNIVEFESIAFESIEFETEPQTGNEIIADGSVTKERGVACVVMTADCLPLMLCDKQGEQVMALHCGWRGIANGIIEAGIKRFNAPAEDLIAWAGPCIGPNAFEVGGEVVEQLGLSENCYTNSVNAGKYMVDLYKTAAMRLKQAGVKQYSSASDYCTYEGGYCKIIICARVNTRQRRTI